MMLAGLLVASTNTVVAAEVSLTSPAAYDEGLAWTHTAQTDIQWLAWTNTAQADIYVVILAVAIAFFYWSWKLFVALPTL